ncbi:hypothetical protein B0H16DRAFT_853008 [Mycena metata]|uniref:RNase III domain-containing protein n=1 Tax=Mycena metata TaxID=1033252 RepID=A0AAD7GN42_9AGAR|nr:hypothetical protein B0H16DRAFT_853008 [Mycena metata]
MPVDCTSPRETRKTPLELIANELDANDPLRDPVPERVHMPLDSPPGQLLRQMEPHGWSPLGLQHPPFPLQYPRDLPPFTNTHLLRTAFLKVNKRLEWLGDALVGLAITTSLHKHVTDLTKRIVDDIPKILRAKYFLGHLALLYGLQLHSVATDKSSRKFPLGLEKMSDIFEAFVGAAALEFGTDSALAWLEDMLDPWVASMCSRGLAVAEADVPRQTKVKYDLYTRDSDGVPAVLQPGSYMGMHDAILDAFGPSRTGLSVAQSADRGRPLLSSAPETWPTLDWSGVELDDAYPPLPPPFDLLDASHLTASLTDVWCLLRFEPSIVCDQRYKWLGHHLCNMVITLVAIQRFESTPAAHLNNIRTECLDPPLLGRLGLMFQLDRHIATITRPDARTAQVHLVRVAGSFRALVGAVYLQFGWRALLNWLEPLFWPWLIAAQEGRLRSSSAAKHQTAPRSCDTSVSS